ncbi:hypothetical protein WMZ97_06125 [Lentibacillus sp. N15]|uniref:hypothetical protein n=1 Tax=Lentibacillus songyuanensis TaxID=3136161 RepID=UPI0031BB8A1E
MVHNGKGQGTEYEITVDMDRNIKIMTKDKEKTDKTFNYYNNSGTFKKLVEPHELKDCVSITPYGIIQDERVRIAQEGGDKYQVSTGSILVGDKLKLSRVDRDHWLGWVPKDSVKLVEKEIAANPKEDL